MKKTLSIFSALCLTTMLNAQTTATFNYTGSVQKFVVPGGVTSVDVDAMGAAGGDVTNLTQSPQSAIGGLGGRVKGTIAVTPGDTIYVYVGNKGTDDGLTLSCFTATGGFNGGGDGFGGYNSFNYNCAGGGGASDIRIGGQALSNRVFVAGGGGGAACSGCTGGGAFGGNGGGLTGADGQSISCFATCNYGLGGTQSGGGTGGKWACTNGNAADGTTGVGGAGDNSGAAVTCGAGGGGGGGYFGGGGGSVGGGGGGSNYASSSATAVTHTQGFQTGKGKVTITYFLTTGINSSCYDRSLISVYPNPCYGRLSVTMNNSIESAEIQVYNILGEKIYHSFIASGRNEIDLAKEAKGVYSYKVISDSKIIYGGKLILQ